MSTPVLGHTIGKKIIDALGLPEQTVSVDLHIAANEIVSVKVEHYPDRRSVETVIDEIALYERRKRRFIPGVTSRFDVGHEMILPERAPEKRP